MSFNDFFEGKTSSEWLDVRAFRVNKDERTPTRNMKLGDLLA